MIFQVVVVCSAPSEIGDWNYCCSLNHHLSQWKLGIYLHLYHGGGQGHWWEKKPKWRNQANDRHTSYTVYRQHDYRHSFWRFIALLPVTSGISNISMEPVGASGSYWLWELAFARNIHAKCSSAVVFQVCCPVCSSANFVEDGVELIVGWNFCNLA